MMKALIILNILQLIVLAIVLTKVTTSSQHSEVSQSGALSKSSNIAETPPISVSAVNTHLSHSLSEDDLRLIIRDEVLSSLNAYQPKPPQSESVQDSTRNRNQVDEEYLTEVQAEFEVFLVNGVVSEVEMANFQIKLAQLDDKSRKDMLGKLVRAMSSGELKGRL